MKEHENPYWQAAQRKELPAAPRGASDIINRIKKPKPMEKQ